MVLNRSVIICIALLVVGAIVGSLVTYNFFPKIVISPSTEAGKVLVTETVTLASEATVAYVQKSSVNDADLELNRTKPTATVSVNGGAVVPLKMVTNTNSQVKEGKLVVSESTAIKFDIVAKPDPLKNTLGVGYGNNGHAYLLEHRFTDKLGTWFYLDSKTKAGGVSVRF